ncbi:DUF3048 domain-containing protein [Rarobacter faecitabidus]|uniref:DUF3048 family protein n=1 Tax=Rarobacter faecitabidus TaxID=13243 RepID=A0A542ZTW4_RARFA|nr:DUF3048 domain-containing protein [Rarobacter faecitabidus]TQL63792.1 DUF3048 family protein [Rarobacter faecitabidus]
MDRRHFNTAKLTAAATGLTACAALLLAGCGKPATPEPVSVSVLPPAVATRVPAPEPVRELVWPLTGVPTDKVAKRPALSIKIENSPSARPQIGIDQADIVYEEVVEGGITRFIAVFQSKNPKQVAPVRSVRPMDANIVAPLGGLLAYSGGQRAFLGLAPAAGLQVISMDRGDAGFSRMPGRAAPHNVLGDTTAFWKQAKGDHKKLPDPAFEYASSAEESTAATAGSPIDELSVQMSQGFNPRWKWDEGKFLRSEGSTPATVADGTRLSAANVVVLKVKLETTKYRDPAGTAVPETIVIGSGKGLVISAGKAIEVEWKKKDTASPVILTANGEDVELAPGNTWVELMPNSQSWSKN